MNDDKLRRLATPAALVLAGMVAGGILAGTLSATAEDSASGTMPAANGLGEPPGPVAPESGLAGSTKEKVEAAVKAEYPQATIDRTETDATGAYESHITTPAGEHLTVLVNKDFEVTGTESFPGRPGGAAEPARASS
jgi:hypothetical protein